MAPVLVTGTARVFAPGGLSLLKVCTDGSQLRGGLRAAASATDPRQIFGYLRRHKPKLQKAALIVKPRLTTLKSSSRIHHLFAGSVSKANVALRNVH